MEINGFHITALKRDYGIEVLPRLQNDPQRALEYVAGAIRALQITRQSTFPVIREVQEIIERFGVPVTHQTEVDPEFFEYQLGFSHVWGFRGSSSLEKPRKKFREDREPDLVEQMETSRRDYSSIDPTLFPGNEDNQDRGLPPELSYI